jgi:serine/threonine-protein kinase
VHRDLKPDNVFLARLSDGRVQPKILDFGIAKLDTSSSPKLTQQGTVLGSPAYMAPEQAWGESDIDQRADIWAFTVMLYELLTGTTPFGGDSYNALLFAIARNEPASILEHGVLEPELWEILKRGLEKNKEARYQDMRELGRAFAAWLITRGVKTDITKAPLAAWVEQRVSPHSGASLFPSLSPGGESSEPPPVIAVTQVANPVIAPSVTPPPKPAPAGDAEAPRESAEVRKKTAEAAPEPKVVERLKRNAAAVRFSFSRGKRAPRPVLASQRSEASRAGQFVTVAMLSAAAFVAAAYWQSRQSRHTVESVAEPAPPAVVSAQEPSEPPPETDGVPSVSLAELREKGPSALADSQPREFHREREKPPAPAARPRPRKRPSSGDLKNPFR